MTPAEFKALQYGYEKKTERDLRLLAWQVANTIPNVKRRPSPDKLYKLLTKKEVYKEVDNGEAKQQAARAALEKLTGGTDTKKISPKRMRAELSKLIPAKEDR